MRNSNQSSETNVLSGMMMNDVRKFFCEWKNPQYYNFNPKRFVLISLSWSLLFLFCYHVVNFHHIVRNHVSYYKQSAYKQRFYVNINNNRTRDTNISNSHQDICLFNKAYYDQLKIRYSSVKKNCTILNREVCILILIYIYELFIIQR